MNPLLAYYGDDLTGSTDVMEALEKRGVPTVLFTRLPESDVLARFSQAQAVGLAGTSRSETPDWMDRELPKIFEWLKSLGAELNHYKVCSTFDSSPELGSIGRALDLGSAVWGQASTPVVVGAPELRRWTAFGNLFAGFRGDNFRIDRHPVMSRHPVTPMGEADLRVHLSRQTKKEIGLIDLVTLKGGISAREVEAVFEKLPAVLIDVLDGETQAAAGRLLWERRERSPFVVGSSGVQYALTAKGAGTPLEGRSRAFAPLGGCGRIAAVSGSCSPTTARQIATAQAHGFEGVMLDAGLLAGGSGEEEARGLAAADKALDAGLSPLLYTALGAETAPGAGGQGIGRALGRILAALIARHGLSRAVVAGGDTSSHAIAELDVVALECVFPLPNAAGSPLCRAHGPTGALGLELGFKGGQVGDDDYFVLARDA
ncbi:MAG TPA: four-carbon acid sugar kinase family protein [Mesorhizobium sp.]|jgi:uncharacterized protein YgbK (DUF1537 family)|nr:four-carbon acid sugar kinase family protein [Mesorhizobium sp.]